MICYNFRAAKIQKKVHDLSIQLESNLSAGIVRFLMVFFRGYRCANYERKSYFCTLFFNVMKKIQMVDIESQYLKAKAEFDSAIEEVLHQAQFVRGPQVTAFQHELESYVGAKYVVTCASGTDALQLALMSLDLQPGDEVITIPFTFVSTVEVIALLGLKPVFVDVRPDTFNMDVEQIEAAITDRTRVILPVHLFGQCVDMERLLQIAEKHNLKVVEDACQAIGAEVTFSDGTKHQAGTMGWIGCTSFFPSKNLGCFGDGGAVFTQDEKLAEKIRTLANHGMQERYHYEEVGINSRLDTLQAAILRVKLRYLDQYTFERRCAAESYSCMLKEEKRIKTPFTAPFSSHVFHQYTVQLRGVDRSSLVQKLKAAEIPTAIYYPVPLHLQKAYQHLGYKTGDFPISEMLSQNVLSLPMHSELTELQISYITQTLIQNL